MVMLSPHEAVMLTLLLVCVPLQMWFQHHQSSATNTADTRDGQVFALMRELHKSFQKLLSPHYWSTLVLFYASTEFFTNRDPVILEYSRVSHEQLLENPDLEGECLAVEVMRAVHPDEHFASSVRQRRYRTRLVEYRVGQVVRHDKLGLKGVIIGWDETCKAPQDFIDQSYEPGEVMEVCQKPNYVVLIDTDDFHQPLTHYFSQMHLSPVSNSKVKHPDIERYFAQFDGSRYLPKSWLAAVYPED